MSNFTKLQEIIRKKKAALKTAGRTIKAKAGKNNFVILPSWKGEGEEFFHDFGSHYIKDEAGALQAVYICTAETFGKPCAICNGLAEAQRTVGIANPQVAELVKEARAGKQYLVNVLALDSDTPDVPQVLALGKTAFDMLLTTFEEWGDEIFGATNPQIVIIERTGTTVMDTRYTCGVSAKRHTYKREAKPINLEEFVAQESDEMERKTLLAVRTMAGINGGSSAPRLTGNKDRPSSRVPDEFEDVRELGAKTKSAAPWETQPSKASEGLLSEDIDSMLEAL